MKTCCYVVTTGVGRKAPEILSWSGALRYYRCWTPQWSSLLRSFQVTVYVAVLFKLTKKKYFSFKNLLLTKDWKDYLQSQRLGANNPRATCGILHLLWNRIWYRVHMISLLMRWTQSTISHVTSLKSFLILYSQLMRRSSDWCFFPWGFLMMYGFFFCFVHATWPILVISSV